MFYASSWISFIGFWLKCFSFLAPNSNSSFK